MLFLPLLSLGFLSISSCSFSTKYLELSQQKVTFSETISEIDIEIKVRNVSVIYDSAISENAVTFFSSEEDQITVTCSDNRLSIKETTELREINIRDEQKDLIITLNQNTLANIKADVDVGNIYMENLHIEHLEVDSDVGNLNGDSIELADARIDLDCGGTTWNASTFNSLAATLDIGSFIIKGAEQSIMDLKMTLETSVGTIKIFDEHMSNPYRQGGTGHLNILCHVGDITIS